MMDQFYGNGYGGWGMSPSILGLGLAFGLVIILIVLALKGLALWHAAKRNEKWWFIILLVVNTVGILELVYLLAIAKVWPKHGPAAPTPPSTGANQ